MNSLTVKNLSIALEALSRVPGYRAEEISNNIYDELKEHTTKPKPEATPTNPNEEIPF